MYSSAVFLGDCDDLHSSKTFTADIILYILSSNKFRVPTYVGNFAPICTITMMYQIQAHLQLLSSFSKLSEIYPLLTLPFLNQNRL